MQLLKTLRSPYMYGGEVTATQAKGGQAPSVGGLVGRSWRGDKDEQHRRHVLFLITCTPPHSILGDGDLSVPQHV